MKYPAYPRYRDSGVEWLGDIPEEWVVSPLKHLCTTITDGSHFSPETVSEGYSYITVRDIDSGQINMMDSEKISEKDFLRLVKDGCQPFFGDVLFSKDGTIGKVAIVGQEVCVVLSSLAILRPSTTVASNYLLYLIQSTSGEKQIESFYRGSALKRITLEKIVQLIFCRPPIKTQKSIATFLDTETLKIDGLIKDYEELITLLQEKRQALISHTVTRGLSELVSPDDAEFGEWAKPVKFKDSGVEWLGEIPEEWVIKSIKWITPVQRGASPRPIDDPKYFDEDGEYAWVRISDVTSSQDGYLRATTDQLSELGASLSVKIEPGSLFISIAGTVGKPCIAKIKACIHDGFVYFPLLDINPKYLFRVFESGSCYGGLGKFGTQLNLNTDTIGSIKIGVPPVNEIENILLFLDKELSKIDSLILETESAISLLKEHRSALITNAVTGKINVEALV